MLYSCMSDLDSRSGIEYLLFWKERRAMKRLAACFNLGARCWPGRDCQTVITNEFMMSAGIQSAEQGC